MFARVGRFLKNEIVDLLAQRFGRVVAIMTHGRHEAAFTDGKGRGQRIIEGGSAWLTAVPPASRQHVAADFPVAFLDYEAVRRLRPLATPGLLSPVGGRKRVV